VRGFGARGGRAGRNSYRHKEPEAVTASSSTVRAWAIQPMVGILNSAPARMPVGQREVIAFCLV
jgi:hypothetical protein